MRITIETEDGEKVQKAAAPPEQAEAEGGPEVSPPAELAARAAAMGAASAGPAPAEMAADEPTLFIGEPGTPETAPEAGTSGAQDMSAGGAPGFAVGEVQVEEAETESEEGETEGEDEG
jgi:hypothetical protein